MKREKCDSEKRDNLKVIEKWWKYDSEQKDNLKIIEKWWKYDSEQRDNLKVIENDEKMIPNREIG